MKVCIIGTGASGWIVCSMLKKIDFITEIVIIGSSKVPPIGVGESTTLNFVENFLDDAKEFVRESDAAVKYGVFYKNWAETDFIHHFKSHKLWEHYGVDSNKWGQSLANKPKEQHIHELIGDKLFKNIQENKVSTDSEYYPHSWHFDAAKFIKHLEKKATKHPKVTFVEDTIVACEFHSDEIEYLIGECGASYYADYFVNCCGDNYLNNEIFGEEYHDLSPILLTNKALVYPLEYTNKREQFHPYTVAKTMKYGWRWITPTQSRIGTGYVFSDKHVSVEEATKEFLDDIGDSTIKPRLVDFSPRMNKKPFKKNSCCIGMSQGFLEPLDAPGLAISVLCAEKLVYYLRGDVEASFLNDELLLEYKFWASFILHQYKTCYRDDSQFWKEQKEVTFDFYEFIMKCFSDFPNDEIKERFEFLMMFQTTAGKNNTWDCEVKEKPIPLLDIKTDTTHHLDYIQSYYG